MTDNTTRTSSKPRGASATSRSSRSTTGVEPRVVPPEAETDAVTEVTVAPDETEAVTAASGDAPFELRQITAPSRLEKLREQFVSGKVPAGVRVSNSYGRFTAYEPKKKG